MQNEEKQVVNGEVAEAKASLATETEAKATEVSTQDKSSENAKPDTLGAALRYAQFGRKVLPLYAIIEGRCACGKSDCSSPGKHPKTQHGLKDASSDPALIRRWDWEPANVGLLTDGLIVVDVDLRHGGVASLAKLEEEHGNLPGTVVGLTGSNGFHLFFKEPAGTSFGNTAGKLGPGLDTRGRGGYVVAPPSNHISGGRYRWLAGAGPGKIAVAPAPTWLAERLVGKGPAAGPTGQPVSHWQDQLCEIPDGQRNDVLVRLAGLLFRRLNAGVAHELLHAMNEARCRPPLSRDEVDRIANSIAGRELAANGGRR